MSETRLQKFMADCGVASRRACEGLIEEGRVKVNGKVIRTQGLKINPIKDQVEVDGKTINSSKSKTYIAFHKPRGILSTMSDPEGRPSLLTSLRALKTVYFMLADLIRRAKV